MNKIKDPEQLKLIINLLDLTEKIVEKYEKETYEAGLKGLKIGVQKYLEKERFDTKIGLYVTWYIKTAIEYELNYKNKDTEIWEKLLSTHSQGDSSLQ